MKITPIKVKIDDFTFSVKPLDYEVEVYVDSEHIDNFTYGYNDYNKQNLIKAANEWLVEQ